MRSGTTGAQAPRHEIAKFISRDALALGHDRTSTFNSQAHSTLPRPDRRPDLQERMLSAEGPTPDRQRQGIALAARAGIQLLVRKRERGQYVGARAVDRRLEDEPESRVGELSRVRQH